MVTKQISTCKENKIAPWKMSDPHELKLNINIRNNRGLINQWTVNNSLLNKKGIKEEIKEKLETF